MNSIQISRRHVKRSAVLIIFLFIIVAVFGAIHISRTVNASQVSVQPLSPISNTSISGRVELSSTVNGLKPAQYEMFWATGTGQWNRMNTDHNSGISKATIDTTQWNWEQDNTYDIRFIALAKNSEKSIEQSVTVTKASPESASTNSVGVAPKIATPPSTQLFIDDETTAGLKSKESDSAALHYIASQPTARWFGGWNSDVAGDVSSYITRAEAAQAVPTLVLYNIPDRDCGSYSAGGALTYAAYSDWIRKVASGIGERRAIVIIEPDAIADMSCLSSEEKSQRNKAISDTVSILAKQQTQIYIDAGNPKWHSPKEIAKRLKDSGVTKATGFSLNVSNFQTTDSNVSYGTKISKLVDNKHFVVDTSRNGNGPAAGDAWCNPSGRALGNEPTLSTGKSLVDAYLWIKAPGESDGACGNGAPVAGEWWQSYADILYRNRN